MRARPRSRLLAVAAAVVASAAAFGCADDSNLPELPHDAADRGGALPAPVITTLFARRPGTTVASPLDVVAPEVRALCRHCMQPLAVDLDGESPIDAVVSGALPSTTCAAPGAAMDHAGWAVLRGEARGGFRVLGQFEVEADCAARSVVRACPVQIDRRVRGVAVRIARGGFLGGPSTVVIGRVHDDRWVELTRYDCGSPEDGDGARRAAAGPAPPVAGRARYRSCMDGLRDVNGDGGMDVARLSPVLGNESRAWASVRVWNRRTNAFEPELRCGSVLLEPAAEPRGGPATVECLGDAPSLAVRECTPLPRRTGERWHPIGPPSAGDSPRPQN